MADARGSDFKLYVKRQTNDETLATGNFEQLPVLSFGLGASQGLGRDDVLSAGIGRDGGDPYLEGLEVGGNAVVPLDLIRTGMWLTLLLGNPTTSGTTDLTHVWKSGATSLPAWTVEKAFPAVPSYDSYLGVKGNTLSLDLAPTGPANMTVGLLGLSETTAGASIAGVPVNLPLTRFQRPSGYIKKDGATLGKVTGGTLNFTNGMSGVRTVRADNRLEAVDLGSSGASGDLRVRFADNSLKTQAVGGTPCSLEYGFSITATKSISFLFPRVFLSRPRAEVNGPGGIELPVSWQAAYDATAGCLMQVTLKNQTASYT
ncbi:phage tail tube protein [Roseomonas xinghualingensis]|uniref:phage tail tube protein n=1 Tax=Roseomonas xinghualingensis TaxID=2986475 RepID=UPI0021F22872|nr:phage tail tube protein [Roseomonas sp. SXEYE001]MCV4209990.1 phage tail tube protein [Roseomonas sp. SXEYE001]